ncbi:MAG: phosphoribosyl transferase [Dehalococcoidia bacterium]|nr:phosphoribosyl transferase [Dehalococcoidia bacterium]
MSPRLPLFENRYAAGVMLATRLEEHANSSAIVLAIPNGGIPVAAALALTLEIEMDIVVSRKLPIPLLPGGGFGAVADDGTTIFNEEVLRAINLDEHQINYQVSKVRNDIRQRTLLYRNNRPLAIVKGRTAIIVDDGLASGYTMLAAVESIRRRQPSRIIVAIPAASEKAVTAVKKAADRVIAVEVADMPKFYIADYFSYWNDLSDDEGLRCFKDYQMRRREKQLPPIQASHIDPSAPFKRRMR